MSDAGGRGTSIVLWVIAIGLAILAMLFFYSPRPIERVTAPAPAPLTARIPAPEDPRYAIAREFVRAEMVSPDAAIFPDTREAYHLTTLGADRYQVSSHGKFQTLAGMRKSWFTVTMRYIGNGRYVLDGKGVELFEEGSKQSRQE